MVGIPLEQTGKAAVMHTICKGGKQPKFNKYSGVVEWVNAVQLWVNLGGPDQNNLFLDQGERMTWYGGKTHYEDTPVIRRMLPKAQGGARQAPILLFCRLPHLTKKGSMAPYMFCGELEYVSHRAGHPLTFEWRLKDREGLGASKTFQRMLKSNT
jgi:hypothetical protein